MAPKSGFHFDFLLSLFIFAALLFHLVKSANWTPINVKSVTQLGPQITPNLTKVSRDGGHSVLINRNIVWLYDDTECLSHTGKQLSFVSNTAAYASDLGSSVTAVQDFGIELTGYDSHGNPENAILGFGAVGDGGWIPFEEGEKQYNDEHAGTERVAIWPGTAPVPTDRNTALLYAPLVYVDAKPVNPARHYVSRGMTLVTVTAPSQGPQAVRGSSGLVFPGDYIQYGGFAAVLGYPSIELAGQNPKDDRDVYVLGVGDHGLQLARVALDNAEENESYSYWAPANKTFGRVAPLANLSSEADVYLPGSFSSGTLFFSPYFLTFVLVYFNNFADSTFWIRYLDLLSPIDPSSTQWPAHGKNTSGIGPEDAEAFLHYRWSDEQLLYKTDPNAAGFNYAGSAHPEYFNRAYYPTSNYFYPRGQVFGEKKGDWIGESVVPEGNAGGDGRNLLLSWTAQLHGGFDTGIYQVQLAVLKFGDIPAVGEPPKPANHTEKPSPKIWLDGYFGPWSSQAVHFSQLAIWKFVVFLVTCFAAALSRLDA